MPFNGAGVFQRVYNWVADASGGTKIRADRHDTEDNGFATGLSNCITKDGQTIVTQNIPMNNKRITGLADPVNPQDAATMHSSVPVTGGSMTGPLIMGAGGFISTPAYIDANQFRWATNPTYFFISCDNSNLTIHGGDGNATYGLNFASKDGASWASIGPAGMRVQGFIVGNTPGLLDAHDKLLPGVPAPDGVDVFALIGALLARIEALESRTP